MVRLRACIDEPSSGVSVNAMTWWEMKGRALLHCRIPGRPAPDLQAASAANDAGDAQNGPWDPAQPQSLVGQRWKFMDDGKLRKVPGRNLFAEPSSNLRSGPLIVPPSKWEIGTEPYTTAS